MPFQVMRYPVDSKKKMNNMWITFSPLICRLMIKKEGTVPQTGLAISLTSPIAQP
jgi:hypothetical protein